MNYSRGSKFVLTFAVLVFCSSCAHLGVRESGVLTVDSIRLTAAGHFLDLRYRVLDPSKANELLGPGVKPILTDIASGLEMSVPDTAKLGPLRQTYQEQRPDRQYFVLFNNTAGLIPGSRVSVNLGGLVFDDLLVE